MNNAAKTRPTDIASTWLLRAEGVGKRYGQTHALIDANLTIAPGESVAIMGPSGSGNTTWHL